MHRTNDEHDSISIAHLYSSLDEEDTKSAVSVILKLRGETCDIDCLYCYEKRKQAPGGARIDAAQVRQLAELFRGRPLAVELHGGEPLTAGREHVEGVLRELAAQPSVVRVSMQTNGVLLDERWLELFDEVYPSLQIGISLDGDAQGNAWRVGYDGEAVYPRVAAALRLPQVRRTGGSVLAPVSSAKTIHAPNRSASSFDPRPHLSAPSRDDLLIPLTGPHRGHLPGQTEPVHHPPHPEGSA